MKKIIALTLTLMMVFALAACGGKTDPAPSGSETTDPGVTQQDPSSTPEGNDNQEQEIDLSQFTAVELPASELLEDWMKPDFGVVTIANGEQMGGFYYSFTISGVTKANEESYRSLIESNGWTSSSDYTYDKDEKQIALGTSAVGNTKESIMTVTITKE